MNIAAVLWVTLDFGGVGTITLHGGTGTMPYNMGHLAVSRDEIRFKSSLSDIAWLVR